jgi:integrase
LNCRQLGIVGVTLHSYRYAWAERAKMCGMPERFAQEALGHNSKAVQRAYAKRALMKIPSLEDYEQRAAAKIGQRHERRRSGNDEERQLTDTPTTRDDGDLVFQ